MNTLKVLLAGLMLSSAGLAHGSTLLFSEDFEGSDPMHTNWDAGKGNCNAADTSTAGSHSGSHSLYYDPNNPSWYCTGSGQPNGCCTGVGTGTCDTTGNCNHYFSSTINDFYLSFWMYPNANFNACEPNAGDHLWRMYGANVDFDNVTHFWSSGCGPDTTLYLEPEPIFDGGSDTTYWDALPVLRGQWNRVEILFKQGVGTSGSYLMGWVTNSNGTHPWNTNGGNPVTNYNFNGGTVKPFDHFAVVTNYDHHDTTTNWFTDDIQIWDGCPPTGAACSTGTDRTPPAAPSNLAVK
jgi:hypothetical protein